MRHMSSLADRIEQKLRALKWSKAELARRASMNKTTLQSILDTPNRSPRSDTISKLADALGVSFTWLATGDDQKKSPAPAVTNGSGLGAREKRILMAGIKEGLRQIGTDPDSPEGMRRALAAFDKAEADVLAQLDNVS